MTVIYVDFKARKRLPPPQPPQSEGLQLKRRNRQHLTHLVEVLQDVWEQGIDLGQVIVLVPCGDKLSYLDLSNEPVSQRHIELAQRLLNSFRDELHEAQRSHDSKD